MMFIRNKIAIALLLLSALALSFIVAQRYTDMGYVPVSLNFQMAGDFTQPYQFYYDTGRGYNQSQNQYGKVEHGEQTHSVRYTSMNEPIKRLRFDLPAAKNTTVTSISSICINKGLKQECLEPQQLLSALTPASDIQSIALKDNKLVIESNGSDPYLELSDDLTQSLDAPRSSILLLIYLIVIIVIAFACLRLLCHYREFVFGANSCFQNKWFWLLFSVSCVLLYIIYINNIWLMLGVPTMPLQIDGVEMIFADTHGVLAAVDCYQMGYDVFLSSPCDAWGRVHAYGGIWLYFDKLGLDGHDVEWIGFTINFIFVFVVCAITNPKNWQQVILTLLIILSPAVLLGIERANVDIFLFSVLALYGLINTYARSFTAKASSIGLLIFATMSKIYPIATLPVALLQAKSIRQLVVSLAVIILGTGTWLYYSLGEIFKIQNADPQPHGLNVFGGGELPYLLFNTESYQTILFGLIAGCMLISLYLSSKIKLGDVVDSTKVNGYFLGYSVIALTFFITTNYDYRCIFLLLSTPFLLQIAQSKSVNKMARYTAMTSILLIIIVTWSESKLSPFVWLHGLGEQFASWAMVIGLSSIAIALLRDKLSFLCKYKKA